MDSTVKMLAFATGAFAYTVIPSAALVYISAALLRYGYGHQSIVAPAVRLGLARHPVRAIGAGLGPRDRSAPLMLLTTLVLPLAVAACYWLVVRLLVAGAFDWDLSEPVLDGVSAPIGLAAAIPTCLYVATGGRRGGRLYPPLPVRPWTIAAEARVAAAAGVVRHAQLVAVTATSWVAAFYVANKRDGAVTDDLGGLYFIGALAMVLLAGLVQAKLPFVQPRPASLRLVLHLLTTAPGTSNPSGGGKQAIAGQVRIDLMRLSRLLDRVATRESRAEAAAGVQNIEAQTIQSAASNLRAFLSNRLSLTRDLDSIRDDLTLIATVLARPRSGTALTALGTRMGTFEQDGSLKDAYRATHRNPVVAGFDRLTAGLNNLHQFLIRIAVLGLIGLAIYQFVNGQIALADLLKSVKP